MKRIAKSTCEIYGEPTQQPMAPLRKSLMYLAAVPAPHTGSDAKKQKSTDLSEFNRLVHKRHVLIMQSMSASLNTPSIVCRSVNNP